MKKYIVIDKHDNVMVALEDFNVGDIVNSITILNEVKKGHKVAINNIDANQNIIKYGYPIGKAIVPIKKGEHVHTHNVITKLGETNDLVHIDDSLPFDEVSENNKVTKSRKVQAYQRYNGLVGIRNELWIIPTVGCMNGQAEMIRKKFSEMHPLSSNYDGIHVFTHPYGCSQIGDDHENTKKALQDMVLHPNAGGVLVLGLGCENNQISSFKDTLYGYDEKRVKFLVAQDVEDEITTSIEILEDLYQTLIKDIRTKTDISKITIGLKCGGSDGLSGLTANPLIGKMTDYFIKQGASAILTEIPEMFGAEEVLLKRTKDKNIYNKLVDCVNDFKLYYRRNNQVIYENPSPGNKKGGITTLEDKSLGCVQKSGKSKVIDVLNYGDIVKEKGLNILSAPGNDIVATTALGMSGCQLVLFSTGRGTPFGGFIPTIKLSSNTEIYEKKSNWIDFDCGKLNSLNYQQIENELIEYIIEVIEGKYTRNEKNNFREIAIFKTGVTL